MSSPDLATLRARLGAPGLTLADIVACSDAASRLTGMPVQRIAVAGDVTVEMLAHAIRCAVIQEGVLPLLHCAPYGAMASEILDPGSALHAFGPELAVLVPDRRAAHDADLYLSLWRALEQRGCRIIQHTLVPPTSALRGVAERRAAQSALRRVRDLNDALFEAGDGRVTWLEADRLAAEVGLLAWSAPRYFHAGKLGFDPRFLPAYMAWFRGAWRSSTGRAKKVLVLDLDDTLWGGAIGDLGPGGVALGPDHGPVGEAFTAWQDYVAELGRRGVILAVCSKNDPALAAAGFDHPHGKLRRDAFAAIVCSWEDKAAGMRNIAAQLDLGLEALVFADDNPSETALVRQLLPAVETVDLGSDPARFIERLDAGHWFDQQSYSDEDFQRTSSYRGRAQAEALRSDGGDLDLYLRSLAMVGRLAPATESDLGRMAQMEQKTNQFNLTTRRYSQGELEKFLDERVILTFHLRDRFADHGLTSTLVAHEEGDALQIDSWLMSCRIFARTAEQFILAGVAAIARQRGLVALVGTYVPSDRNGVVADLYRRLGFEPHGTGWRRELNRPLDDLVTRIEG